MDVPANQVNGLDIILGTGCIGDQSDPQNRFNNPESARFYLNAFYDRGYRHLDTARSYSPGANGSREPILGEISAGDRLTIDTKICSKPGRHTSETIEKEIGESLEALKISKVKSIDSVRLNEKLTRRRSV